jgi:hypothetical protein
MSQPAKSILKPLEGSSAPPAALTESDAATIRAVKGKGLVATVTPTFVVAVVVGLASAWFARKPDPVSAGTTEDAKRCNEAVTALSAEFRQYRGESEAHFRQLEWNLNQLLARSTPNYNLPGSPPTQLDNAIGRQLSNGR